MKIIKNKYFLVFVIIISTHAAFSQEFDGGPIVGLSVCQVDGDGIGGYNKPGLITGLFITRKINPKYHLQIELRYIQKGAKSKGKIEDNSDYYAIRLQYIELPILISYKFNKKLSFEGGLAEGYLYKSEEDFGGGGFVDTQYPYYKAETSVLVGVHYKLTDRLGINTRIQYSITRISKYTAGTELWTRRGKFNNLINFTLTYEL